MGDEFADGTRPSAPIPTADQIQALRKLERAEEARQAGSTHDGRIIPRS